MARHVECGEACGKACSLWHEVKHVASGGEIEARHVACGEACGCGMKPVACGMKPVACGMRPVA